jgi:lipopolysaccharide export system ATP-binding protein
VRAGQANFVARTCPCTWQIYTAGPGLKAAPAKWAATYLCKTRMLLKADNLIKKYKARTVVNDVSVQVSQGEIVGLLGPNGAGKTTTFYMIVGLIKPNAGQIYLDQEDITPLPMYRRARRGVGYLAQEASVFRQLTVEENILAPLQMTSLSKAEQKERVEVLLEEFSLTRVRKSQGSVLSGGERRRTEIARALSVSPKFILLDEPFAGVDPLAVEEIQHIVWKLKSKNIGILITDHNVDETLSITDRAYILTQGKILVSDKPEILVENELVRAAYLGRKYEFKRKFFD